MGKNSKVPISGPSANSGLTEDTAFVSLSEAHVATKIVWVEEGSCFWLVSSYDVL